MAGNKFLQAPYVASPLPIVNNVSITNSEDRFLQAPETIQHLPEIQTIPIEPCSTPGNPTGFTSWEEDPIFRRSPAYQITQEEIDKWNRDPVNYELWTAQIAGPIPKAVNIHSKEKLIIAGNNISVDLEGNVLTLTGEDSKYTGTPTVGTVGGIANNTLYINKPILTLIDELLHAYIEPTIFNFTILPLAPITEVGIPITGNKTFAWDKTNPSNIKENSGVINDLSTGIPFKSGINLVTLSRTTGLLIIDNTDVFKKSYNISALTTKNRPIVSNTFSAQSVFPTFIGSTSTASPTNIDLLSMTKLIEIQSNKSFIYTINWRHFAIAYPEDYGDLVSIKDTSGFENIGGFTKTSMYLSINNISKNYYVWVSRIPATLTNFKVTYSFNN